MHAKLPKSILQWENAEMSSSDAVIAVGRAASHFPIAPVVPGAHARHMRIWLRRWRRLEVL